MNPLTFPTQEHLKGWDLSHSSLGFSLSPVACRKVGMEHVLYQYVMDEWSLGGRDIPRECFLKKALNGGQLASARQPGRKAWSWHGIMLTSELSGS